LTQPFLKYFGFVVESEYLRGNIPTAEFGMITEETACWDIERK
jgi:hypothetical protein